MRGLKGGALVGAGESMCVCESMAFLFLPRRKRGAPFGCLHHGSLHYSEEEDLISIQTGVSHTLVCTSCYLEDSGVCCKCHN